MLARCEALERCRGFDESYNPYGWEEVDLSLRLARYERGKIVNYLRLMRRHATVREWLTFLVLLPLCGAQLVAAQTIKGMARTWE